MPNRKPAQGGPAALPGERPRRDRHVNLRPGRGLDAAEDEPTLPRIAAFPGEPAGPAAPATDGR